MAKRTSKPSTGFTLIELLIVIAVVVVVLALGVPSFRDYIVMNRLKAVNAQLVTDLQFARAEAAARNTPVYWTYRTGGSGPTAMTCYTIYTTTIDGLECNCAAGPGAACGTNRTELKVVQVELSSKVRFGISIGVDSFAFDNVNGGIYYGTTDFTDATFSDFLIRTYVVGDTTKTLHTLVSPAGRPTVCSAGSTPIHGYPICP